MKPGRGRAVYAGLAVASAIVAVGAPGVEAADARVLLAGLVLAARVEGLVGRGGQAFC